MKSRLLLFFFLSIGLLGLGHGFPLLNIFTDEYFFAVDPLVSMQKGTLLPTQVLHGTVTFYLCFVVQLLVLPILFIYSGFSLPELEALLMAYPYLAYIAPRILNLLLFMSMLLVSIRILGIGSKHETNYAPWMVIILHSNLVLLTFMHSGKQWITCIFFLFLAAVSISTSQLRSVVFGSLSFANLPIMGVFWLQSLLFSIYLNLKTKQRLYPLFLAAALIPLLFTFLNFDGTRELIRQVLEVYLQPRIAEESSSTFVASATLKLYGRTMASYIYKLALTSLPILVLGALALWSGVRVRNRMQLIYGCIGIAVYLLGISTMFYSTGQHSFFRYLLPFHVLFIVVFLSLEFPRTKLNSLVIGGLGVLSVYWAVVSTINIVMPTTYNVAHAQIAADYSNRDTLVISSVSEITFPYNEFSATLTKRYTPRFCAYQCINAIENHIETEVSYMLVKDRDITDRIEKEQTQVKIVSVVYDESQRGSVHVEAGMGSYFVKQAWVLSTLGQRITIMEEPSARGPR